MLLHRLVVAAKQKGADEVLIEVTKRPSRAVRVDVKIIRAEWQTFIVQ